MKTAHFQRKSFPLGHLRTFGGLCQREDADMLRLWREDVEETRALLAVA